MSLILDALRKAQQLRLKESKGTPSPGTSHPDSRKGPGNLGKRWIVIGIGLTGLVASALIYWNFLSPPSPVMPSRTVVGTVKQPTIPVPEKKPQEPAKDTPISLKDAPSVPKDVFAAGKDFMNLLKEEKPKVVSSTSALSPPLKEVGLKPHRFSGEKDSVLEESSLKGRKEEPAVKQGVVDKTVVKPATPLSSTPPLPLKEKVSAKSIEVKHEGDKDRLLALEILNHFNLGIQFHNQRNFSKAIQAYQKVIKLDPAYAEAYNNLGMVYQEAGDLDNAFEAYQKSVEINPLYEKGYNNLGILLYHRGRYEEAFESFQKALAINPNKIESHINLGVLFKKQGQLTKAIECYQKALAIDPFHGQIHYNVALLYEQSENIQLAIGHYQQFIKLSSRSHPDLVSKVQRHLDYLIKTKKEKRN